MVKLLEKALKEVEKLPEDDQDAIASWLLAELASKRRWSKAFARSHGMLASPADKALVEHREGRTRPLNAQRA